MAHTEVICLILILIRRVFGPNQWIIKFLLPLTIVYEGLLLLSFLAKKLLMFALLLRINFRGLLLLGAIFNRFIIFFVKFRLLILNLLLLREKRYNLALLHVSNIVIHLVLHGSLIWNRLLYWVMLGEGLGVHLLLNCRL